MIVMLVIIVMFRRLKCKKKYFGSRKMSAHALIRIECGFKDLIKRSFLKITKFPLFQQKKSLNLFSKDIVTWFSLSRTPFSTAKYLRVQIPATVTQLILRKQIYFRGL